MPGPPLLPVSVVVPTIGRVEPLRACLRSIADCDARAAEILVVDQSHARATAAVVEEFAAAGARLLPCHGRGIPVGMNLGLRAAGHDTVLVTHDDCTVDRSWVATAARFMQADPEMILTGRVLPTGDDPRAVPSTKTDPDPHDFTGEVTSWALWPNNMALNRRRVLDIGGFDERFTLAAEDNDLCYRWLRAGRRLVYQPELVVWHHDWRSREQLERLYVEYWRWQGVFYAKHLRLRDPMMLRFLVRDVRLGTKAMAARVVRGRPRWSDWRRGMLRGLPAGIVQGLRMPAP